MIIFCGGFWNESIRFFLDILSTSRSIPYKKTIFTRNNQILRIIFLFSVYKEIYILSTSCLVHFSIIIDDISTSKIPKKVRGEISPRRGSHMDMDEISIIFMKMDAIFGTNISRHIASTHFFHVDILRKIPSLPIDIGSHIRMIMNLKWSRSKNIGNYSSEDQE